MHKTNKKMGGKFDNTILTLKVFTKPQRSWASGMKARNEQRHDDVTSPSLIC